MGGNWLIKAGSCVSSEVSRKKNSLDEPNLEEIYSRAKSQEQILRYNIVFVKRLK